MITRIGQVLLVGKMSNEERATLHFERGVLYDSLGLWGVSHVMTLHKPSRYSQRWLRLQLFRALLTA